MKLKILKFQSSGYTILELLVVVAIISILSFIFITDFTKAKLQFALSRTVHKFEQDTRKMQSLALKSQSFVDSQGAVHPIKGYGVHVVASTKQYYLYADNSPGNASYDNQDYLVDTIDFSLTEPGIIIQEIKFPSQSAPFASINFSPPNPITTITSSFGSLDNVVDIVFAFEGDPSQTKTISINTTGLIEIK